MRRWTWIPLLCCALAAPAAFGAGGLTAELSHAHVEVTSHFIGKKMLVYGVRSHPGVVIVRLESPPETVSMSPKIKVGPFWVAGSKVTVDGAPSLVYLLSSAPLDKVLDPGDRTRYGLTLGDALAGVRVNDPGKALPDWKQSLLALKQRSGDYRVDGHAVDLIGHHLFRAVFDLPADIPLGAYHVEVYLVRHGHVVAHDDLHLAVMQPSFEHRLARAAHDRPWTFGFVLTFIALAFGLGLSMALRWFTRA